MLVFFEIFGKPGWNVLIRYLPKLLWCLGWAAMGIGLGLWNDRKNNTGNTAQHRHYFTYFIFVWSIAFLTSFYEALANGSLRSYVLSCLTAVVIGFSGDSLAGIISKLAKIKNE